MSNFFPFHLFFLNLEADSHVSIFFLFTRSEMISARLSAFLYFPSLNKAEQRKKKSIDPSKYRAVTPISVYLNSRDHFLISAVQFQTMLTAISMSAIATNGVVPAGGSYFMISR